MRINKRSKWNTLTNNIASFPVKRVKNYLPYNQGGLGGCSEKEQNFT